eukprot:3174506-Pleurochrysis_carterae.AAC.1
MRLRRGIAVHVVHKVLLPDRVVGGHPSGARRRRDGWLGGQRSGVDGGGARVDCSYAYRLQHWRKGGRWRR